MYKLNLDDPVGKQVCTCVPFPFRLKHSLKVLKLN